MEADIRDGLTSLFSNARCIGRINSVIERNDAILRRVVVRIVNMNFEGNTKSKLRGF